MSLTVGIPLVLAIALAINVWVEYSVQYDAERKRRLVEKLRKGGLV